EHAPVQLAQEIHVQHVAPASESPSLSLDDVLLLDPVEFAPGGDEIRNQSLFLVRSERRCRIVRLVKGSGHWSSHKCRGLVRINSAASSSRSSINSSAATFCASRAMVTLTRSVMAAAFWRARSAT